MSEKRVKTFHDFFKIFLTWSLSGRCNICCQFNNNSFLSLTVPIPDKQRKST